MGTPFASTLAAVLLGVATCAMTGSVVAAGEAGDPLSDRIRPGPRMSPEQVVRAQLAALRSNDPEDRGIQVAFRFASPDNKRSTGPLPRFARMLKDGPYALMLRYRSASYAEARVEGGVAAQPVTLIGSGEAVTFVFYLSRQSEEGPLKDCWMTDGVAIVPTTGRAT